MDAVKDETLNPSDKTLLGTVDDNRLPSDHSHNGREEASLTQRADAITCLNYHLLSIAVDNDNGNHGEGRAMNRE